MISGILVISTRDNIYAKYKIQSSYHSHLNQENKIKKILGIKGGDTHRPPKV